MERIYNIPLRRTWLMAPKWRRSKKAISAIKVFLEKHTKVKTVKLSKWINEAVWENGGKSPPGKLSVKVEIDREKSLAKAELVELPKKANRKLEVSKKQAEKAKKVEASKPKEVAEEHEHKEEEKKEEMKAPTPQQELSMHK